MNSAARLIKGELQSVLSRWKRPSKEVRILVAQVGGCALRWILVILGLVRTLNKGWVSGTEERRVVCTRLGDSFCGS